LNIDHGDNSRGTVKVNFDDDGFSVVADGAEGTCAAAGAGAAVGADWAEAAGGAAGWAAAGGEG
jgi:hypothetical protein